MLTGALRFTLKVSHRINNDNLNVEMNILILDLNMNLMNDISSDSDSVQSEDDK